MPRRMKGLKAARINTGGRVLKDRAKLPNLDMPNFKESCPKTLSPTSSEIRASSSCLTMRRFLGKSFGILA
jgi:hypothetical protein